MEIFMFEAFGCRVINRNGQIFLIVDSGGSISRLVELEITMEEAERLKKSEQDAYKVLMAARKRNENWL